MGMDAAAVGDRLNVCTHPRGGARMRMSIDAGNPWGQRIAFPGWPSRSTGATRGTGCCWASSPTDRTGGSSARRDLRAAPATGSTSICPSAMLHHYRNGHLRHRFTVGIGAPSTPTTVGRFFVWAQLEPSDPSGPYGSYLLGLSGFSEVLTDWPGGGRIAIHGTADPRPGPSRVVWLHAGLQPADESPAWDPDGHHRDDPPLASVSVGRIDGDTSGTEPARIVHRGGGR